MRGSKILQKAGKYIRERRRWLAAGLACVTAFCAVRTRALTADTLAPEPARVLNCADQIHRHTDDCYDNDGNLICGQADFVVHTHDSAVCYGGDGELICPLPEIKAYTHTEDCYDEDGSLICEKEEVVLHTHTDACYDEDGSLICGRLEVLEHVHTDACFADAEMMPIDGDDGEGENEGEQEPGEQEPNEPENSKYTKLNSFYLWLKVRDIQNHEEIVYAASEWETDADHQTANGVLTEGNNWYLIPVGYFTAAYGDKYGYRFDPNDTGCCPFVYAPNAYNAAGNLTAASYVYVKNDEITAGADDTETDGSWYVRVQDTTGLTPNRSNIYYTTYNTQSINAFRFWLHARNRNDGGYTTVAKYDGNNTDSSESRGDVSDALQVRTLGGSGTNYYLIPISYFTAAYGDTYGYRFDPDNPGDCPFAYAPDADHINIYKLASASYVYIAAKAGSDDPNAGWYVMIQDTYGGSPPRSNIYYVSSVDNAEVVTDAVSPSGTVINLFDYWVTAKGENDVTENHYDSGVNAGHPLKFKATGLSHDANANAWAVGPQPYCGIVQNTLENGYPALTGDAVFVTQTGGAKVTGGGESLNYLFDPAYPDDESYRDAYRNVTGLLQVDGDGYYYYDSQKNYAEFDAGSNGFTLYNTWALTYKSNYTDRIYGQFFPFDAYGSVDKLTDAGTDDLNHFFGMTLTARFVQKYDGHTNSTKNQETTFEFSGDDDVWIFIDGVLAADLGGLHDPASVSINFATGKIVINEGTEEEESTTLYEMFDKAGAAGKAEWSIDEDGDGHSDTFANNTYHTLKFFYLERGSYASNMSLKYNLTEYPPSSITKVDQYGDPVPNAGFAIYAANEEYEYLLDGGDDSAPEYVKLSEGNYTIGAGGKIALTDGNTITPRYVGTTDEDGEMYFLDEDGVAYPLPELEEMFGEHFILKEITVPEGYRLVSEDVYLYVYDHKLLICDNTFESGVYSDANLQVAAPVYLAPADPNGSVLEDCAYYRDGAIEYYDFDHNKTNGTLFAAVLKYVGPSPASEDDLKDTENWRALYGTDEKGFTLVSQEQEGFDGDFIRAAAYAVSRYKESKPVFAPSSSGGSIIATMNGLPGDFLTYYSLVQDKRDTQYTVAYYWTTLDLENASWSEVSKENTVWIDADAGGYAFDRAFGATINVPNLVNRLIVQKLDEHGELRNGAAFALYAVEEVKDEDGSSTIYYVGKNASDQDVLLCLGPDTDGSNKGTAFLKDGDKEGTYSIDRDTGKITVKIDHAEYIIKAVAMEITRDGTVAREKGSAVFSNMSDGAYYLREIAAPEGYELNTTEVMVLVDDTAVYANAGDGSDGVTVARGPGYLAASLSQFASQGEIDNTLTWLYERLLVLPNSTSFADVYTALDENGKPAWEYLKANHSAELTDDVDKALTTYLKYDTGEDANTLFNYTVNTDRYHKDTDMSAVTRRLYTDVGWSYYLLYQDHDYGSGHTSDGAAYEDLHGKEISNLFSRSVYVQITDKPTEPDDPDNPDHPNGGTVTVKKVWKDNENKNGSRPESVTVQLLKDGEPYGAPVTLNEANNWTHEWKISETDRGAAWGIKEIAVPGYTVSVKQDGYTFTVTNTLTPPPPPDKPDDPDDPDEPDKPDEPDEPDEPDKPDEPDEPDDPDKPDDPDTPDEPDEPDEPDIPQTGQLWWPVPLLACGGMGLFLVSRLKRRNSGYDEADE